MRVCSVSVVLVELWDECTVGDHGERKQLWFVRQHGGWVPVAEHPAAKVEEEADEDLAANDTRPPGTVWCRRYSLDLPHGSVLRKFESWPRVVRLSVMEYLRRGMTRMPRAQKERYYRLTRPYHLEPLADPRKPQQSASNG